MKKLLAVVILLLVGCGEVDMTPRTYNWKNVDGDIHQTKAQVIYQCDKETHHWTLFMECMNANGWYVQP